MRMSDDSFTLVITSCGRFDLLTRTLASLSRCLDEPPARAILIEDSGDASVRDVAQSAGPLVGRPIETIVNDRRLGQMASIDRAYAMVKTPFIFHCEDDWEFTRAGFIASSRRLLDAMPDVSMVGLRDRWSLNPLLHNLPDEEHAGERVFMTDPAAHPEYFSYSFNPGLRRLSDYRQIGPFSALGHEADVSLAFKRAGFRMAYLSEAAVAHIGDDRHVNDPMGPKRPTNPFERWGRSVSKRIKRVRRAVSGSGHGASR
ncbi:MAG: glycosyltransferase [Alphaproteobacteria bacterium]|nr:glycosyltransferase [Alphaproteobacteria bacterium]